MECRTQYGMVKLPSAVCRFLVGWEGKWEMESLPSKMLQTAILVALVCCLAHSVALS